MQVEYSPMLSKTVDLSHKLPHNGSIQMFTAAQENSRTGSSSTDESQNSFSEDSGSTRIYNSN